MALPMALVDFFWQGGEGWPQSCARVFGTGPVTPLPSTELILTQPNSHLRCQFGWVEINSVPEMLRVPSQRFWTVAQMQSSV